jgi:PAS domain S-box-containing protein
MEQPNAATTTPRVTLDELPHLLLDHLDSGLMAVATDGEILFLNRSAEEIFDLKLDEVCGRPLAEFVDCDDQEWLIPVVDDRVGDPRRTREVSLSFGEKDIVIQSSARPLVDRRGRPLGALVSFVDISDTAEDEEFRRTAERLAHLGELSAVVAHEIRNPLTGIRTTIQFLGTKLERTHPLHGSLADIISELDRIEKIITDLLVLGRPPRGERVPTDINALLEKGLDRILASIEDAGFTVKRELSTDLPLVEVDEATVLQVFSNMLSNAVEAMQGTEEPTLKVSSALRRYRVKRPTVEVSFADTGCGIPPDVKDRIFDPFFTMKTMGTGLGLPLSLQIMKDHGGTIHVRNRQQGGTIFKLQFPVPDSFGDH